MFCWWITVGKTVSLYETSIKLDPMGGWMMAPQIVPCPKETVNMLYGKWDFVDAFKLGIVR